MAKTGPTGGEYRVLISPRNMIDALTYFGLWQSMYMYIEGVS